METSVVRDTYVSSSIMEMYFSLEKEVEFYIFEEATEWNVRRCSRVSAVNILPYWRIYRMWNWGEGEGTIEGAQRRDVMSLHRSRSTQSTAGHHHKTGSGRLSFSFSNCRVLYSDEWQRNVQLVMCIAFNERRTWQLLLQQQMLHFSLLSSILKLTGTLSARVAKLIQRVLFLLFIIS